jgi:hypothetical protein
MALFLMKECTRVNKVYSTLTEQNFHTVLHAEEIKNGYPVHAELSIYTLFFCKIFVALCLQKYIY